MIRDLDLPVLATDSRRLEVVVDGLPLLGGANWQSTPHMMVQRTGTAWFLKQPADVRSVVTPNWWVLGPVWWCWQLKSEGAGLPKPGHFWPNLQRQNLVRKHHSWRLRWASILACATAKAVATSLLELKAAHGSDGDIPSCSEVVGDHRCLV